MHAVLNQAMSLEEICNYAVSNSISHLWVISPVSFYQADAQSLQGYSIKPYFPYTNSPMASLVGRKVHSGGTQSPRFNIIFLAYSSWGWQNCTAQEVMANIELLESRLGVTLTGSPATAGQNYLGELLKKKHPKWMEMPQADLSLFHFTRTLVWYRAPSEDELKSKYLYCFDKNSAYPRVGKAEKFGIGEPTHYDERTFDPKLPGMWRLEKHQIDVFDDRLPHPLLKLNGLDWLPTAIVKMIIKMGCVVEVKEAWVFEDTAYVFKEWAENLWQFRSEYAKDTSERSAIKSILNDGIGKFQSQYAKGTWKHRPDWHTSIVSHATANMYYNIYKFAEQGYFPVHVQSDALFYLSDVEMPELVVPGLIDHKDSMGGYKFVYRIEVDASVQDMLVMKKNAGMKVSFYNDRGEK